MWRGQAKGARKITSKRRSRPARSGWRPSQSPRGADDAAAVDGEQRLGLLMRKAARLDLDEDGDAEALGDQVDLADRGFHPPRDDAVELGAQEQRRPAPRRGGRRVR